MKFNHCPIKARKRKAAHTIVQTKHQYTDIIAS